MPRNHKNDIGSPCRPVFAFSCRTLGWISAALSCLVYPPRVQGRSEGSFPEQRLVIIPQLRAYLQAMFVLVFYLTFLFAILIISFIKNIITKKLESFRKTLHLVERNMNEQAVINCFSMSLWLGGLGDHLLRNFDIKLIIAFVERSYNAVLSRVLWSDVMVGCIKVAHRFVHPAAGAKRITSSPNQFVLYISLECRVFVL